MRDGTRREISYTTQVCSWLSNLLFRKSVILARSVVFLEGYVGTEAGFIIHKIENEGLCECLAGYVPPSAPLLFVCLAVLCMQFLSSLCCLLSLWRGKYVLEATVCRRKALIWHGLSIIGFAHFRMYLASKRWRRVRGQKKKGRRLNTSLRVCGGYPAMYVHMTFFWRAPMSSRRQNDLNGYAFVYCSVSRFSAAAALIHPPMCLAVFIVP